MLRRGSMPATADPANPPPILRRPSRFARALGGALTVLVHLLVAWALLAPGRTLREEPAALPPLRVSLLGSPAIAFEAPAPLEAVLALPEPVLLVPQLIVQAVTPPLPVSEIQPPTPSTQVATAAPAQVQASGAGPQLRRSNGRAPDCQLPAWLTMLSQSITFSLRYPAQARQLGESGTAYVRLSVARNGRVMDWPLLQSSGHHSLDHEARDVVRRIGRFAPVPSSDCAGYDVIVVDQPIRFGG